MTFVSYAQNFEDVMLYRALKHITGGFYLDIGAAWPDEHSVTKAFYDMGWSGINIEPNPVHYSKLQKQRTRDINLRIAVGSQDSTLIMNFIEESGLSTLDNEIAARHQDSGWQILREEVTVTTLQALWRQYIPQGQTVHFLKVDVEGFEKAVIEGNDWSQCRPWVLVIEATLPMLQSESYEDWEPLLLAARYTFVYADGLNRFYVANEHAQLVEAFRYPPNVFDNFVLSRQQQAEAKAQQAEAKAQQAEAKAQQAEAKAQQAEAKAQQAEAKTQQAEVKINELGASSHHWWQQACALEAERNSLCQSRSWRYTAPLRIGVKWLRSGIKKILYAAITVLHRPLARLIKVVLQRPMLKQYINQRLIAHPYLRMRIKEIAQSAGILHKPFIYPSSSTQQQESSSVLTNLTPRAREIYVDLKAAIECKRGNS